MWLSLATSKRLQGIDVIWKIAVGLCHARNLSDLRDPGVSQRDNLQDRSVT